MTVSLFNLQQQQRVFDAALDQQTGHAREQDQALVLALAANTGKLAEALHSGVTSAGTAPVNIMPVLTRSVSLLLRFANRLNINLDEAMATNSAEHQQGLLLSSQYHVGRMAKAAEELDHRSDFPSYAQFGEHVVALVWRYQTEFSSRGLDLATHLTAFWAQEGAALVPHLPEENPAARAQRDPLMPEQR